MPTFSPSISSLKFIVKYQPRTWNSEATVGIPLESITLLQDPVKHTPKHPLDTQNIEEPDLKMCKTSEER